VKNATSRTCIRRLNRLSVLHTFLLPYHTSCSPLYHALLREPFGLSSYPIPTPPPPTPPPPCAASYKSCHTPSSASSIHIPHVLQPLLGIIAVCIDFSQPASISRLQIRRPFVEQCHSASLAQTVNSHLVRIDPSSSSTPSDITCIPYHLRCMLRSARPFRLSGQGFWCEIELRDRVATASRLG